MNYELLFNLKALLFVVGGIASLLLTVMVKIAIRKRKIQDTRAAIEDAIQREPSLKSKYGDLDEYFKNEGEFKDLNFLDEIFINSIQPLLLLSILILFDYTSTMSVIFLIAICIFSFGHEIFYGEKNRTNGWYRIAIICFWLFFYYTACYDMKNVERNTYSNKTVETNGKRQNP